MAVLAVKTTKQLTDVLAERVMGWRLAPGRYIKSGRGWIPRWRFQPLVRIENAFELLDASTSSYRLEALQDGTFTAEVRVGSRIGKAFGQSMSRTTTIALARALRLESPEKVVGADSTTTRPGPASRSKTNGD